MNHGVRVLHTHAVRSEVCFHDVHHCVVGIAVCPVTLPFEHSRECGDGLCAGLEDPPHRVIVRYLIDISAAIFNHEHFVPVVNGLSIAATKFLSSQEFIEERSIGSCFGNTALIWGQRLPLKAFVSTVVSTTGTSKTLVAFASATVLFMIVWRSKLLTPNNICGW